MTAPNIYIMNTGHMILEDESLEDIPLSRYGTTLHIIGLMHLVIATNDTEFHIRKDRLNGYVETRDIDELPEFISDFVSRWMMLDEPVLDDEDDGMDGDAASALASAGWGTDEDYGYYGQ